MEPVGLTASIISIATLAVQLGDALRKAAEFWESVEDAPASIRRISRELRLLVNVLSTIKHKHQTGHIQEAYEPMIKDALDLAKEDVDELAMIISGLARQLGPANCRAKRQCGKIQIVLKGGKISKFRNSLENVKSILSLLQVSQNQ
jgi:N-terminal domain on NACHT_NTPase and P-loop NTPases